MNTASPEHYDVIIVGAGMAGASLACALTRPGGAGQAAPSVLLLEAAPISLDGPAQQPGFDSRSTVLSASSRDALERLDLWSAIAPDAEPIVQILVSDQGRFGGVRMNAAEAKVPALGYVAENTALGRGFNQALLCSDRFTLRANTRVRELKPVPGAMQLLLENSNDIMSAALVVLADGGRSGLAAQLGIEQRETSYEQSALIANIACALPHAGRAWERFTPNGPLALLPLPDFAGEHRCALVWTQPQAQAEAVLALPDAEFLARLHAEFGYALGAFTKVGKRALFPLRLTLASEQVRPSLALLGNVAHTLHPVAGQGFNLALRDTLALAHTVRAALVVGESPGAMRHLLQYQQSCASDQELTIGFSHHLVSLFSSNKPGRGLLRQLGMAGVEHVAPLRQALARQAMGYRRRRVDLE
ncbi:MAG: 2-octaprenyl-6-methoxyphenyl hydroxylase [Pseudomonadales bacterium]|jgi:2-octaprenyl-6-methoxyphenol hydroxylase|nr:2-octaprenyl-6-methoxyphenyl hydroxylase [Pseudomonadales bacterium]